MPEEEETERGKSEAGEKEREGTEEDIIRLRGGQATDSYSNIHECVMSTEQSIG